MITKESKATFSIDLNIPNENNIMYTTVNMKNAINNEYIQKALHNKSLFGKIEFDHAARISDINTFIPLPNFDMSECAFVTESLNVIEELGINDKLIVCIKILDTIHGKHLFDHIAEGNKVELLPTGYGDLKLINGIFVVSNFMLETINLCLINRKD